MRTDHKQNLQTFTFTILEKWWVSELIPCIFYKKEFSTKKIERRRRRQNNNRPINLPKVITFFTDYKYTT